MTRKVLLSRNFEQRLYNLTKLEQETNFVLLYRRQQDYCPIENMFMTGVGIPSHVRAQQDRMNVANEFFRRNPEYQFVKGHTHSAGTIKKHGESLADNFSSGDIASYDEQISHNPDFIGMLVTPITMKLYAPDSPKLQITETHPYNAETRIRNEIKEIAQQQGVSLTFKARKVV